MNRDLGSSWILLNRNYWFTMHSYDQQFFRTHSNLLLQVPDGHTVLEYYGSNTEFTRFVNHHKTLHIFSSMKIYHTRGGNVSINILPLNSITAVRRHIADHKNKQKYLIAWMLLALEIFKKLPIHLILLLTLTFQTFISNQVVLFWSCYQHRHFY